MASSNYAAWSVVAGEQPTTAKWNILGTNDAAFNTGQGFNDNIITQRHLSWSNLFSSLNVKNASNTSSISPASGDNNFASQGCAITFTVAANCVAYVSYSVGSAAASDYEFQPSVYLDGNKYVAYTVPAAANTNGRATVRAFSTVIPLTTGTHTLSGGAWFVNGSGYNVGSGAAYISAIIFGYVTA